MTTNELPTRQQVLNLLKVHGRMTVKQLSQALGITPMGVRQHLDGLSKENLVTFEWLREGRGRPSQVFALTPQGDEMFPRNYGPFAVSLLDDLYALGGEAMVDQLFARRAERLHNMYVERMQQLPPEERVAALANMRDSEGYLAGCEQIDADNFRLVEHNCPVCIIAAKYPQACRVEQQLFSDILGSDFTVQREDHIASGDRQCRYLITRKRKP